MIAISGRAGRNRHFLGEGDDFWLGQRVSCGVKQSRVTIRTITAPT
jgi:hypothetical protein